MRVIFLDVDGVLNSVAWFNQRGPRPAERLHFDHNIDPATIGRLNRLCQATGAVLVISSVWRKGCGLPQLQADFARVGCAGRVFGKTPDCSPWGTRGNEIAVWLGAHPRATTFVILDDDADVGSLRPHLVQTAPATGLTEADVDRATALLCEGQ